MNKAGGNPILVVALLVFGGLVLLVLFAIPAMGMMGGFGMMSGWASSGSGGYGWGWLIMLLFLVLLIGGIALLAVWLFRPGHPGGIGNRGGDATHSENATGGQSALSILQQRYARGEITKEQYEQIKRDIEAE